MVIVRYKLCNHLIFQLFIKPLLHILDERILLFNAPVNVIHVYVSCSLALLKRFGDTRHILLSAQANRRPCLWWPLLP
jgi:hypothetical protein